MKIASRLNYRRSHAFTIVELLVVIVVIGVLASIALISYSGISKKASVASIQSDLSSAYKKFKIYQVENSGYPTGIETDCTTPTDPAKICLKPSLNNQYTLAAVDNTLASNQTFCLTVLNTSINVKFRVTQDGTQAQSECSYVLTLIAGPNGTVNTGGSYEPGTSQTITATANNYYVFNSWTGDTGCSGLVSHLILMDSNKTCTANFGVDPNWIPGVAATILAGKFVRNADLSSTKPFNLDGSAVTSPQGAINTDPSYMSNMSLVNPQLNPSISFTSYPAQNACKAIGGRVPNVPELISIYANMGAYGGNFTTTTYYWSATQNSGGGGYLIYFSNGGLSNSNMSVYFRVRCVGG